VSSVSELYEFLRNYAQANLGLAKNSSLGIIFDALKKNSSNIKEEHYKALIKKIESALYFGNKLDITEVKKECTALLKLAKKGKIKKLRKESSLPALNPVARD